MIAGFNSAGNSGAAKEFSPSILQLRHWPARLDLRRMAEILGFKEHEIPILIQHRLIPVLGKPAPNAPKYFAAPIIARLANDPEWLSNASMAITRHWQKKNRLHAAKQTQSAAS